MVPLEQTSHEARTWEAVIGCLPEVIDCQEIGSARSAVLYREGGTADPACRKQLLGTRRECFYGRLHGDAGASVSAVFGQLR